MNHSDPAEVANDLADQVEKWYKGGMAKRDEITAKLKETGHEKLADEIDRWFENGNRRFIPLILRLRSFSKK